MSSRGPNRLDELFNLVSRYNVLCDTVVEKLHIKKESINEWRRQINIWRRVGTAADVAGTAMSIYGVALAPVAGRAAFIVLIVT
jgi:hypothetical protein